jgi:hypothetical protein
MGGKGAVAWLLSAGFCVIGGLELWAGSGRGDGDPFFARDIGIRLLVGVDRVRDGVYRYRYLLENASTEEVTCSALHLPFPKSAIEPVQGTASAPSIWGDPIFWKGFYLEGYHPLALWSHPIPPLGSLLAATVQSPSPPGLVEVRLDAGQEKAYERWIQEALEKGYIPKREKAERWRREALRSFWVLGPVPCQPGTYHHWDQVLHTFEQMEALGWFSPETGQRLREALLAARRNASSKDRKDLVTALAAVEEHILSLPRTPASEALHTFFQEHWDLLREHPCPPSRPFLSLPRSSAEGSLGEVVPLRAQLRDQATLAPLPGRPILLEVVEGPRKGWRETAVTDGEGWVQFDQKGVALGREEIRMRLDTGEAKPSPDVGGTAVLSWTRGANLRSYALSPARFRGGPGDRIRIQECTSNAGDKPAPPSVTAFFLLPATGEPRRIPLARRPVPELAPGQSSCLIGAEVEIPGGIPVGEYRLEAETDAEGQVVETDEGDNRFTPYTGPEFPFSACLSVPKLRAVPGFSENPPGTEAGRRDSSSAGRVRPATPPPPAGTVAWLAGPLSGPPSQTTSAPPSAPGGDWEEGMEEAGGMSASGGMEDYCCTREELPAGLLRQVIGKVTLTWYWLEMKDAAKNPNFRDFTTWEPVPVPLYEEGPSGFQLKARVPATKLGPFGFARWNEGASLTFFATARKGDFVEVVLHTRTGERAWLRLEGPFGNWPELTVSYTCLLGRCADVEEGSGHPDWSVLNPHKVLRLYLAPDPLSPWIPFQSEDSLLGQEELEKQGVTFSGLYMGDQINGFVRIFLWQDEAPGPLSGVTVGWLPIRDPDGALLLWPVDYSC